VRQQRLQLVEAVSLIFLAGLPDRLAAVVNKPLIRLIKFWAV
jgi:hypothetical protein